MKCRGCGADIRFVTLKANGKKIPVNPGVLYYEDPRGDNVIITADGRVSHGCLAAVESKTAVRGWVSHFATCPVADRFRRGS